MSDGEFQITDPKEWTEMGKDEMRRGNDLPSLKDLVKDKEVMFSSFRQGVFYYTIFGGTAEQSKSPYSSTSIRYQFPVPIEDIGTATLLVKDKAITFMRWIRRAIEDKTFIKL